MKTKLLRKLRKRFNWKYSILDKNKVLYIYDKQFGRVGKNLHSGWYLNDLEYLLREYDDKKLIEIYRRKKVKLHFNRL
jgi:Ca2+-binding EF-hand superfamily protein